MPYARYVTQDDDRVRPLHRSWHGVTLPIDHPWWATHRPPNGWRCRCRVVGVTQQEYEQGFSLDRPGAETDVNAPLVRVPFRKQAPDDGTVEWRNPATGELKQIPRGIDPGFDYNAGTLGQSEAFAALVRRKLEAMGAGVREAAEKAGVKLPAIAKEVADQGNWQSLGLQDLRDMKPRGVTPELLTMAINTDAAVQTLRDVLDVPVDGFRLVDTPVGRVAIADRLLMHVVEKRPDARERFGRFILPTLSDPDEVWSTRYDDETTRRRFIKLFEGSKYDMLVIVRELADGSVLWNVLNRGRKGMNAMRVGKPIYQHNEK